jgi:putative N6-adenine-specific DNA methylase
LSSSPSSAFFATAPRGLELLLQQEISSLGGKGALCVPGGVSFEGGWDTCYRTNLRSRIASRVLWKVQAFAYRNEDDVYKAVKALQWPRYFDVERTLRVNVTAQKSPLRSLEFATLRVKDAVCDRFRETLGRRPDVERAAPDVRIHLFLERDKGTLYLDTSGEPLFMRGWRAGQGEAPLRENLAAGIVMLTRWRSDEPLLDPMCGGGTLLVEAAAMARGRAPGAKRGFGFQNLKSFKAPLWETVKRENMADSSNPVLYGSDNDPEALKAARRNLAAAGVERWVKLERTDVLERAAPAPSGVMVMNPPYGERMASADELARFYPKLGDALKRNFTGWRCYIFTADLRLPNLIRLEPSRRTPLWNGALECRLYEFEIVRGRPTRVSPR